MKISASQQARPTSPVTTPQSTFPGTVKDAGWSPGSGIALPGGGGAPMGFYVDAMVNPLAKTHASVKLDPATNTITVTVNGKPGRPNLAADQLRHMEAGIPRGMQMDQQYKLVVKDSAGNVLKRADVRPMPAA
jgi:hypothetical protein